MSSGNYIHPPEWDWPDTGNTDMDISLLPITFNFVGPVEIPESQTDEQRYNSIGGAGVLQSISVSNTSSWEYFYYDWTSIIESVATPEPGNRTVIGKTITAPTWVGLQSLPSLPLESGPHDDQDYYQATSWYKEEATLSQVQKLDCDVLRTLLWRPGKQS